MVMADRSEVPTANLPLSAIAVAGLAQNVITGLAKVPFRQPFHGVLSPLENVAAATTRQVVRTFMGYSSSLPVEEFRSIELVLDRLSRVVLPPWVRLRRGVDRSTGEIAGVPGIWLRPRGVTPRATILYLHGGGYIGTSPEMYTAWVSTLVAGTGAEAFVPDYRLAPEFPFPAGVDDARAVHDALRPRAAGGVLIVAGDSGGGGLATSLVEDLDERGEPGPDGLVLLSPEVDLDLDDPSISENAMSDILPWNIPVSPYLRGVDPADHRVSALHARVDCYPPTIVVSGGAEMFRDSVRRLVARMEEEDVAVQAVEVDGAFHVFPILLPWSHCAKDVVERIDDFVDGLVEPVRSASPAHAD
jgi:acetyl esterase/lipase